MVGLIEDVSAVRIEIVLDLYHALRFFQASLLLLCAFSLVILALAADWLVLNLSMPDSMTPSCNFNPSLPKAPPLLCPLKVQKLLEAAKLERQHMFRHTDHDAGARFQRIVKIMEHVKRSLIGRRLPRKRYMHDLSIQQKSELAVQDLGSLMQQGVRHNNPGKSFAVCEKSSCHRDDAGRFACEKIVNDLPACESLVKNKP
jgi:hypothetical protein